MGDTKQVKVDNWGTFFLQRLKHFFNRTDYCDLTLQFQDNAQLKVHRLVLNACTEYFELLERTCEMYEDCLIMPDDLQADVVVPIVNFMYTGQLEYKYDLLDRLYQTAQIMNMSVLTKLLDAHRSQPPPPKPAPKKYRQSSTFAPARAGPSTSKQKVYIPSQKNVPTPKITSKYVKRPPTRQMRVPVARPTRYELPEELDRDDLFESSFTDISYESKPLMIHPQREDKRECSSYEPSSSKKFEDLRRMMKRPSTSKADIAEFKRLKSNQSNAIFEDNDYGQSDEADDLFDIKEEPRSSNNNMYDHVIEMQGAKVTIETKTNENSTIDHAKIISEVLKKYPHLVKNNKNIKLKIVNTPTKTESRSSIKKVANNLKRTASPATTLDIKPFKKGDSKKDFTYETDITDTAEVGRLIALGVENVKGPWLCLICGTPGRALNFCSYHKFRNHLVEVHNERPPSNMCEFCGLKSGKRNHLLHHIYTKHGVPPPPSYHFPKCSQCSYIALTQAFLVKHKMTHTDVRSFNCNVCQASFKSSNQLLYHIQQTGHKICPDRKANLQCIYCMKVFLRESNLYAHLKSAHKSLAREDGIIDNSDEEELSHLQSNQQLVKSEPISREERIQSASHSEDEEEDDEQYQIHQQSDGKIQIINKKVNKTTNPKILNESLSPSSNFTKHIQGPESPKPIRKLPSMKNFQDIAPQELTEDYKERIVVVNQNEFLMKGNEVPIVTTRMTQNEEFILSDLIGQEPVEDELSPSLDDSAKSQTVNKKLNTINQPYHIVVSNEAEYKALMASNPSIIFQDGIESKTLAVLGHSSEITTANIDLDSSQNGDMMIIQDNFPMNVSEAITTDNSNIVVVYSHPIDSQEKQFVQYSEQQILGQSIQRQIVQTTQVLPSITATAPMIDDEILVQQTVEPDVCDPWQTEGQNSVVVEEDPNVDSHVTAQDECQQVQNEVQVTSSPTVVDKGLTELAELQIMSQPEADLATEAVILQPSDVQQEVMPSSVIVSPSDSDLNNENFQRHEESENQELLEAQNPENQEVEVIVTQEMEMTETEVENSDVTETVPVESEEITPLNHPNEVEIPNEDISESNIESESSQETTDNEPHIVQNVNTLKVVNEQLQSLAADWSDDESTTKITENKINAPGENTTENDNSLQTDEAPIQEASEVEESIENIQQEMENQMTTKPTTKSRVIITSDITLPSSSATILTSVSEVITSPPALMSEPKELEEVKASTKTNISSLLNDWEDNDSQPELNGEKALEKPVDETIEKEDLKENETVEEVSQKDEKLKNLDKIMSDWDEDEDKA